MTHDAGLRTATENWSGHYSTFGQRFFFCCLLLVSSHVFIRIAVPAVIIAKMLRTIEYFNIFPPTIAENSRLFTINLHDSQGAPGDKIWYERKIPFRTLDIRTYTGYTCVLCFVIFAFLNAENSIKCLTKYTFNCGFRDDRVINYYQTPV